jgi:hypothetical protein
MPKPPPPSPLIRLKAAGWLLDGDDKALPAGDDKALPPGSAELMLVSKDKVELIRKRTKGEVMELPSVEFQGGGKRMPLWKQFPGLRLTATAAADGRFFDLDLSIRQPAAARIGYGLTVDRDYYLAIRLPAEDGKKRRILFLRLDRAGQ